MSRRKGISMRGIILLLIIIFLIIVGIAYYLKVAKEKPVFGRLGIIPEIHITETTTILISCNSDEDCLLQTKCEGKMLFYRTGSCGDDQKCSYGNWTFKGCTQSIQYCGADCVRDEDCLDPPNMCDINRCTCM